MPWTRSPARAGDDRVRDAGRIEIRAPALLVVSGELKVESMPCHPHRDRSDAVPRAEPRMQRMEDRWLRLDLHAREAERGDEEGAAVVLPVGLPSLRHLPFGPRG